MLKTIQKLILMLIFMLVLSAAERACAAGLEAFVDYDNGILKLDYHTEARYGQMVSFVLYRPEPAIMDFSADSDKHAPANVYPLTHISQMLAAVEARTDYGGKLQREIPMSGFSNGYYIVSASGSGHMSDFASALLYFEDQITTAATLIQINHSDSLALDRLIKDKPLLFGSAADSEEHDNSILNLFASVKSADFHGVFSTMQEVKNAYRAAMSLRSINQNPQARQRVLEESASALGIDISGPDYTGYKNAVIAILSNIVKVKQCTTIRELAIAVQQSMGVARINRSTQSEIPPAMEIYADAIGINYADYIHKRSLYGATNIDKVFVGADFNTPQSVLDAYHARITALEPPKPPVKNDSGGDNGNGGAGRWLADPQADYPVTDMMNENEMPPSFIDIDLTHWAYDSVIRLKNQNILSGYEDNTFRPDNTITREEFVKIVVAAFGYYDQSAVCDFVDLVPSHWSAPYIASAVQRALIFGFDDNSFRAQNHITREDACVILHRILQNPGIEAGELSFHDVGEISDYALSAVKDFVAAGILRGVSEHSFEPKISLTRAQAAVMLNYMLRYIER